MNIQNRRIKYYSLFTLCFLLMKIQYVISRKYIYNYKYIIQKIKDKIFVTNYEN